MHIHDSLINSGSRMFFVQCSVPTLFLQLFLSLLIGDLTSRMQSQPVPDRRLSLRKCLHLMRGHDANRY